MCVLDELNGPGRHEKNMDDNGMDAPSVEECCQLCAETEGCVALNFKVPSRIHSLAHPRQPGPSL